MTDFSQAGSFDRGPDEDIAAQILRQARERAKTDHNYDSELTRTKITSAFEKHTGGKRPYEWQLNVTEALLTGLDCVVIAGTGAGKTMPFMMPLLAYPKKHVIVISPLDALEIDQARRFRELGITAVAVNGKTYNACMQKELDARRFQIIITSPEMCLQHSAFREFISRPKFSMHVAAIVIDEAHCISQWGEQFRPEYSKLGSLRAFVPTYVPILVTSATLPPSVLSEVCRTMNIDRTTSYVINLGIDRPNITWEVRLMNAGKTDLASLRIILPKSDGGEGMEHGFKQTMVFGDDIAHLMQMCRWVRENTSEVLHNQVAVFNSRLTQRAKRILLERFTTGAIKVLFTTEAAGMGCDIPHIELVVQVMVPESLSVWMQRAGRAGRSPTIQARAVLLVQPTVFQEKRNKKILGPGSDNTDVTITYVKQVEDGLRAWLETPTCRRDVADDRFACGHVKRQPPTGACCDNCEAQACETTTTAAATENRPQTPDTQQTYLFVFESPSKTPRRNGKRTMSTVVTGTRPTTRRDGHLKQAKTVLTEWRLKTWLAQYSNAVPFGPSVLLPDPVLEKIASRRFADCTELSNAQVGWSPSRLERHGEEVLMLLRELDTKEDGERLRSEKPHRTGVKKRAAGVRKQVKAKREPTCHDENSQPQPHIEFPTVSPPRVDHFVSPATPLPSESKFTVFQSTPVTATPPSLPFQIQTFRVPKYSPLS